MNNDKTKIHILDIDGICLFSNLSPEEIDLFKKCNAENEIIRNSIGEARHGKVISDHGTVYVVSYDKDIYKHSKLFKKQQFIVSSILPNIGDTRKKAFDDFKHDIPKIHGHNIQEIFSLIPQNDFQKQKTAQEQVNFIKNIITSDSEKTARSLLKIIKNNSSISNEFTILNSRYTNEYIVQLDSHNIYKVFHNVLVNFFADLNDINVFVNLDNTEDIVIIDFLTFKGALIPFFDNMVKYVMPNSEVKIIFENTPNYIIIKIEMLSLSIKKDEISKITEEGYVGHMAKKSGKSGKGLGLSKIKNLLSISNSNIEIYPNIEPTQKEDKNGLEYEVNLFKIFVKKDLSTLDQ